MVKKITKKINKGDLKVEIKANIPERITREITKASNDNMSGGGAIYGFGFIGAMIYYISNATTLWMGVTGFFKSIFWPSYIVFEALKFFGI